MDRENYQATLESDTLECPDLDGATGSDTDNGATGRGTLIGAMGTCTLDNALGRSAMTDATGSDSLDRATGTHILDGETGILEGASGSDILDGATITDDCHTGSDCDKITTQGWHCLPPAATQTVKDEMSCSSQAIDQEIKERQQAEDRIEETDNTDLKHSASHFPTLKKLAAATLWHHMEVNSLKKDINKCTHFGKAVCLGDANTVKEIILAGADVNEQDILGRTPLLIAVYCNRRDIVRELFKNNADINKPDYKSIFPLLLAVRAGFVDVVTELLHFGANVNARGYDNLAPIHWAAMCAHVQIVKELINGGADVNAFGGTLEQTALHLACNGDIEVAWDILQFSKNFPNLPTGNDAIPHFNYLQVVCELIKGGAFVNVKDKKGSTPLHLSASCGKIWTVMDLMQFTECSDLNPSGGPTKEHRYCCIVKELIRNGARVNSRNIIGATALHLSAWGGYTEITRELLGSNANVNILTLLYHCGVRYSPLLLVSKTGCSELVADLVQHGAVVDCEDESGLTPLFNSAWNGHTAVVQELIRFHADVNKNGFSGNSPLHIAVLSGNDETAMLLINNNADIKEPLSSSSSTKSQLLIHVASGRGCTQVVQELVKLGIDIDVKDDDGETPIIQATKEGHINTVKEIHKLSHDINIKDKTGSTALHWAVREGYTDIAKELLRAKADVNIQNEKSFTALHWAVITGNLELATELMHSHADAEIINCNGSTAMDLAVREDHKDIVQVLLQSGASMPSEDTLRDAIRLGSVDMTRLLLSFPAVNNPDHSGQTLLHSALQIGDREIIDSIMDAGGDVQVLDRTSKTLIHHAAIYGHGSLIEYFLQQGVEVSAVDESGRNALHWAVIYRHEEAVEILLHHGIDCNLKDNSGQAPKDYLNTCENESSLMLFLNGNQLTTTIFDMADCPDETPNISDTPPMNKLLTTPGQGEVQCLEKFDMAAFTEYFKKAVEKILQEAIPEKSGIQVIGCGSAYEGTKIGLPDEIDFLVILQTGWMPTTEEGDGYGKMAPPEERANRFIMDGTYGVWLWSKLVSFWSKLDSHVLEDSKGKQIQVPLPPLRHPDHKTCTTWVWLYSDDLFQDFPVSIDLVPATSEGIPAGPGEISSTWKMTTREIESKHLYYRVPKVPHKNSELSKKIEPGKLSQLGQISYPTAEVAHLVDLDKRVKDVYIVAKSLRMTEVCGFKVRNDKGQVKLVNEYVTSYMLKTSFLHQVEMFLNSDMSLGRMVLIVYQQLERSLRRKRLSKFINTDMDVLAGSRQNIEHCLNVCGLMTRFVMSLYEHDFAAELKHDKIEEKRAVENFSPFYFYSEEEEKARSCIIS